MIPAELGKASVPGEISAGDPGIVGGIRNTATAPARRAPEALRERGAGAGRLGAGVSTSSWRCEGPGLDRALLVAAVSAEGAERGSQPRPAGEERGLAWEEPANSERSRERAEPT